MVILTIPAFASFVSEFLIRRREIKLGHDSKVLSGSGFWIGSLAFLTINLLLPDYCTKVPSVVSFTAFFIIPSVFFIFGSCVATFYYVKRKKNSSLMHEETKQ